MKKLIFLALFTLLLSACTGPVIAQLTPVIVNPGANCQALIPNVVPTVNVIWGCSGGVVTQSPAAGTVITGNSVVTVTATGNNKRVTTATVNIIYADTIKPKFVGLTTRALEDTLKVKTDKLFNAAADMNIKLMKAFDAEYLKDTGTNHSMDYDHMVLVKTLERGDDGQFHGAMTYYSRDTVGMYEK
jgi:hypothetical protein